MMRVECQHLTARAGSTTLLQGLTFTLDQPGFVGVLGPNGAGKSTLLRHLAGYQVPCEGIVQWNGLPLSQWSSADRAAACGYMPQQFTPAWNYAVREILELGIHRRTSTPPPSLAAILEAHGLETLAGRRWNSLSGGERARVILAASVATAPPLVLADEPGASLDLRHKLDLLQRLKSLSQNALVIVVMHDLDLALRFCDRLILLESGYVVADDTPTGLLDGDALERTFRLRLQKVKRQEGHDQVIGIG